MIGSALFVEFPSRVELDAWLEREPYVRQNGLAEDRDQAPPLAVLDGKTTP
jgi:hypothetical protein